MLLWVIGNEFQLSYLIYELSQVNEGGLFIVTMRLYKIAGELFPKLGHDTSSVPHSAVQWSKVEQKVRTILGWTMNSNELQKVGWKNIFGLVFN